MIATARATSSAPHLVSESLQNKDKKTPVATNPTEPPISKPVNVWECVPEVAVS